MADMSTSNAVESKLAEVKAEIASNQLAMVQVTEQLACDEQLMNFLLNADSCREDFYEIRSLKTGEVRRIVINGDAEIVFDSEGKVVKAETGGLPEFDEVDEKYSQVIQDDAAGRDYFKRLRGLQRLPKISQDLPSAVRRQMKQELQEGAKQEARQLRQVVVDNFRQVDSLERESDTEDILLRSADHDRQLAELTERQEVLARMLLELQKALTEARDREEAVCEAKRKAEHDCRRQAWLDRLYPAQMKQDSCGFEVSPHDRNHLDVDAQSEVSTEFDEE